MKCENTKNNEHIKKSIVNRGFESQSHPMQSAIEAIHLKFTIEPSLVEIAAIGGILAQALRASGAVADVERDRPTSDSELPNADRNRLTAGNEFTILFTSSMVSIPPFLLNNSIWNYSTIPIVQNCSNTYFVAFRSVNQ